MPPLLPRESIRATSVLSARIQRPSPWEHRVGDSIGVTRLHLGSLALRPAALPLGNLRPPITRTPLPGARKVYGQLLSRDFNPLDLPPITANTPDPVVPPDPVFPPTPFSAPTLFENPTAVCPADIRSIAATSRYDYFASTITEHEQPQLLFGIESLLNKPWQLVAHCEFLGEPLQFAICPLQCSLSIQWFPGTSNRVLGNAPR